MLHTIANQASFFRLVIKSCARNKIVSGHRIKLIFYKIRFDCCAFCLRSFDFG